MDGATGISVTEPSWNVSRTLTERGTDNKVVVSLRAPQKVAEQEWRCDFSVTGVGPEQTHQAHGLDAFQALIVALDGIHSVLSRSGRELAWEGGEVGDTGFPPMVPQAFGLGVVQEVQRSIEEVVHRFAEQARARRSREEDG
jgi:hypothetical protein